MVQILLRIIVVLFTLHYVMLKHFNRHKLDMSKHAWEGPEQAPEEGGLMLYVANWVKWLGY